MPPNSSTSNTVETGELSAAVFAQAHAILDEMGVERAEGKTCDDPDCDSLLIHRLKETQTFLRAFTVRQTTTFATVAGLEEEIDALRATRPALVSERDMLLVQRDVARAESARLREGMRDARASLALVNIELALQFHDNLGLSLEGVDPQMITAWQAVRQSIYNIDAATGEGEVRE